MHIDTFLKFEEDNKLFNLEVNGFKYWHYIRFSIYSEINRQKNNTGQAHSNLSKEPYMMRVMLKLKQWKYWIFRNPLIGLRKRDLLVLNHQRRVKNGDYFDCIYTDSLLKNIDYSYYVFEKPLLEKHFNPVMTESLKYFDYINFMVTIKKRVIKGLFRFSLERYQKEKIEAIVTEINRKFNSNLDQAKVIQLVESVYLTYKISRKYYKRILDKVEPKAIVEVVSYATDRFIINELAHEKGIPIIELQHGTMGKYHIAYNFAEKIDLPTFPDFIFSFGRFWNDNTRLPLEDDKVRVVGWPYFEQKVREYKQNHTRNSFSKRTILFISQGTIGKKLSKIAVEASDMLDKNKYKIIYKLHPGEYDRWKDEYPWLIGANLEVIDHNLNDMHYYFSQSDIQVGVYSTALFEGLGYGLKTIVVKLFGYETMNDLIQKKVVYLAQSAQDIFNICGNKNDNSEDYDITYFWQNNSIDNIKKEIDKIMKMRDKS